MVVQGRMMASADETSVLSKQANAEQELNEPQEQPAEKQQGRLERSAIHPEGKKRSQRMFGVLLGTLNKFNQETKNRKDAVSFNATGVNNVG